MAVRLALLLALFAGGQVRAQESVTAEPGGDSYHYVSHHSIDIHASPAEVWQHLIQLRSWMVDFDMEAVSGAQGEPGQVLRLYEGQEFYVQLTQLIPNRLMVVANLPSSMQGELSTGVAVITLHEAGEVTRLDLTMSRRFSWYGEGANPLQSRRESSEFQSADRALWARFLSRLRELAEG